MDKKKTLRTILIYAGIVLLLYALSVAFAPKAFEGKVVNQSDISSWAGMANEAATFNKANPEDNTSWTNSLFGGMPTFSIIGSSEGDLTTPLYKALFIGPRPVSYLFLALLGGFLMMLAMGCSVLVSLAGAIAVGFCSYNFQIIQVGHNTKMQAIALMTWVLAALIFTYRSALRKESGKMRWLSLTALGAALFGITISFQVKANHPQITYYLAIIILLYALTLFIWIVAKKDNHKLLGRFFAASALLLVVGLTGIATNAIKLVPTYKYTPYTMRGGSELSSGAGEKTRGGLDIGYATAWSYGLEETPNLLIADFNGGASVGDVGKDSKTAETLKRYGIKGRQLDETLKGMPLYWGPQPFTAGPMYMGAVTIFLFVLGLFLYRGKEKWWIAAACLIAVFLSWGNHMLWFTELWFKYAPMYNKFRTVSMALVVLQVCMPLLGFVTLDKVLKSDIDGKRLTKGTLWSLGITGGFCLLFALIPSLAGDFVSEVDTQMPDAIADSLVEDRKALLAKSALRSLLLICATALAILLAGRKNDKSQDKTTAGDKPLGRRQILAAAAICLLVCIDLFSMGKRYLNEDHFVTKEKFSDQYKKRRPVDEAILVDSDPDYRVLDLSVNTFNDSFQCYWHKCIGGYSPVKLQRYQDLIDRFITTEMAAVKNAVKGAETIGILEDNLPYLPVISMLNTKYIILDGEMAPVRNRHALGNAWFVDSVVKAANPNEEISLLGAIDPAVTAVVKDAAPLAEGKIADAARSISLQSYAPNELHYRVEAEEEGLAIFSEIWYAEGWKAWVEPTNGCGEVVSGKYRPTAQAVPLELFCADWTLRAAVVPKGEYNIVMRFEPDSLAIGTAISKASSIALFIIILLSCTTFVIAEWKPKK